jgi:K+-sensing histidine kinase KdpD
MTTGLPAQAAELPGDDTRAGDLLIVTAALADAVRAVEVYAAAVDRVAAAVRASSAGLWLMDEDRSTARLVRSTGYHEPARAKMEVLRLDATPGIPATDCLRRGQPIWVSSQQELLRQYPHLHSDVTPGRDYRVACLPLAARGRTLGVLALTIELAGEASEEERSFLMLVARYTSQAIERLRLLEAERRSRAAAISAATRLGILSRATRAFVDATLDLPSRLEAVVSELGDAFDSAVGIALLQADGHLHTVAVYHPLPEGRERLKRLSEQSPLRLGEGITGKVASTGQSAFITTLDPAEMAKHVAPAYREFIERFPTYALMCAPLQAHGRIIGTVTASRTRAGEAYGPEDLLLLEELADRAAVAIENSRLYQENATARARAEQLYRFAQAVVAATRVEQVFEAAMDAIEVAIGTRRVAILTFDSGGVMRFRAWRGLSDAYRAAVEGHSPWARDAAAPEPIMVHDVGADPAMGPYLPVFRREGIGAIAFIPLVTRGRLIGKFMVYHDRPHEYAPHEVETVRAIANHLASVITRFAATAKLEETIRQNELFAGVLAHDLRNPLSAIMTAAQLVLMRQEGEGGRKDDRNARPLSRILTSGKRMTGMIEQLLDFTRARTGGGIEIQPRDTNLADLCAQVIEELELAHPEWRLHREVAGELVGSWDAGRLLQVISNLVANAGQHGRPAAGIRVRLDGRRPEIVILEVHNQGAVPEALLPYLFDPFRTTSHRRDRSSGLGLGLFIVREIVHAHGGTVEVASTEVAGTTFTIRLPRRAARGQQPARSQPDEGAPHGGGTVPPGE